MKGRVGFKDKNQYWQTFSQMKQKVRHKKQTNKIRDEMGNIEIVTEVTKS